MRRGPWAGEGHAAQCAPPPPGCPGREGRDSGAGGQVAAGWPAGQAGVGPEGGQPRGGGRQPEQIGCR